MPIANSSRQMYGKFVDDYKQRRLDDDSGAKKQPETAPSEPPAPEAKPDKKFRWPWQGEKRASYMREHVRWLWPHRGAIVAVSLFALAVAAIEMVEPLFMRFIIDKVLLNTTLTPASRFTQLSRRSFCLTAR